MLPRVMDKDNCGLLLFDISIYNVEVHYFTVRTYIYVFNHKPVYLVAIPVYWWLGLRLSVFVDIGSLLRIDD